MLPAASSAAPVTQAEPVAAKRRLHRCSPHGASHEGAGPPRSAGGRGMSAVVSAAVVAAVAAVVAAPVVSPSAAPGSA